MAGVTEPPDDEAVEVERRVPEEPLLVEVHHGDRWYRGRLLEWQRWSSGWRAYCSWTTQPGYSYLRWVNGDRVRPRNA